MVESNVSYNRQQMILEHMTEAVILLGREGEILDCNTAAKHMIGMQKGDCIIKSDAKRKNKKFYRLMREICQGKETEKRHSVSFENEEGVHELNVRIERFGKEKHGAETLLMIDDVTTEKNLRRFQKDSAITFSAIIICICLYLFAWSLMEFTLGLHLK